jgi:integrase
LTPEELANVWQACETLDWPFGPIVRLLIVTGARREEITSLRWSDIDIERREIRIPAERYKTKIAHTIPLSDLALEIIESLRRLVNDGDLVFPSQRDASVNPVSGFSLMKRRLDELSGVSGWRIHDLRRSVATGLQRLGVRLEVTEAVLGHLSGSRGGIVGVYQRH